MPPLSAALLVPLVAVVAIAACVGTGVLLSRLLTRWQHRAVYAQIAGYARNAVFDRTPVSISFPVHAVSWERSTGRAWDARYA